MLQSEIETPRVDLAPLDGISDFAYRQIVRAINPNIVLYSEFTNIFGIERSPFVRKRLICDVKQQPYFIQIYGNNVKIINQVNQREVSPMKFTNLLGKTSKYRDKYRFSLEWIAVDENPVFQQLFD